MSSGLIDEQEYAELEAAERGELLPRPATYKRRIAFRWMTDEEIEQDPLTSAHAQELETEHQRVHQATVEYLRRKAFNKSVTQRQVADEYGVSIDMMKWRLRKYREHAIENPEEDFILAYKMARRAQLFKRGVQSTLQEMNELREESDPAKAYHLANYLLSELVAWLAEYTGDGEVSFAAQDIIADYDAIAKRAGIDFDELEEE